MTELKPCPFCGGKPEFQEVGAAKDHFCIKCSKCWSKSVYVAWHEKQKAVDSWNRRCNDNLLISIKNSVDMSQVRRLIKQAKL